MTPEEAKQISDIKYALQKLQDKVTALEDMVDELKGDIREIKPKVGL